MMIWYGLAIIFSVLLMLFLIYHEYTRENTSNRGLRILTSILAVAALCLSIMPLTYRATREKGHAIVLTGGYSQDSVNRFLKANRNCCAIFSYNAVANDSAIYYTGDIQTLADSLDEYNRIEIFGYGFSREENDQLKNDSLIFHPTPPPPGIRSGSWKEQLSSGEPFVIQGRYHTPSSTNTKITLSIASAVTDSLVSDSSAGTFMLQTVPRHTGRAIYKLRLYEGKNLIETNEIPVEVIPAETVRVLMLSSAPNFETRFLKDWLYNSGNSLVVRTTISRNKIDYQYLNSARINVNKLSRQVLQNFDLVVADAGELNSFNRSELQLLINAVEADQMGIIIRADQPLKSNNIFSTGINFRSSGSGKRTMEIKLEDYARVLAGIELTDVSFILPSSPVKVLATSASSIIAASTLKGSGKIVVTSLNNSYFWSIAGQQQDYSNYWRTLITAALPTKEIKMNAGFGINRPRANQSITLVAQFPEIKNPDIAIDSARISLRQNSVLNEEWSGTWWPVKTGWVRLNSAAADTSIWKYVYPETSHQAEDAWRKIEAGNAKIKLANKNSNEPIGASTVVDKAVPAIVYYLIFLICAGYLWLEKKLVGDV